MASSGSDPRPITVERLAPVPNSATSRSSARDRARLTIREPWSADQAQAAIERLDGVVSASLVEDSAGSLQEIHVLATCDRPARTLVKGIEDTLRERFDRPLDRRIVSIAQYAEASQSPAQITLDPYPALPDVADRLVLAGFRTVGLRDSSVSAQVRLAWGDSEFVGSATGADVAPQRLEVFAAATLMAVEAAVRSVPSANPWGASLALDGVVTLNEFGATTVLVSVTALAGEGPVTLAGTAMVDGSRGQAVVLATMQATDRWARGLLANARH